MGRLVAEVVDELNQDNSIRPQSAYVNMKKQEVLELKAGFEAALGGLVQTLLAKWSPHSTGTGTGSAHRAHVAVLPSQHELKESFAAALSALEVKLKLDLNDTVGNDTQP